MKKASHADTSVAHYIRDTMAFMFETRRVIRPTAQALASVELQGDYYRCWQDIKSTSIRARRNAQAPPRAPAAMSASSSPFGFGFSADRPHP